MRVRAAIVLIVKKKKETKNYTHLLCSMEKL